MFQRLSDAIMYILPCNGYDLVAYIDNYIGIAPSRDAQCQFNFLPTSLTIKHHKLKAIHSECFQVAGKRYLSKKKYQSLLGKFIYLHKCVV